MVDYDQGKFYPKNPKKYKGNVDDIWYRSGWEKKVMRWLDENPNVISWVSEETIVPYKSPIDGKTHRYFPDFLVESIDKNGNTRTTLIEVKPIKQTREPIKKRKSKQYITEVLTYGINKAKWNAATKYCESKGWDFKILTESGTIEWSK